MRRVRKTEPSARSQDQIKIPRRLRLEWLDTMAHDPELSGTAYKIAGIVGTHLNNQSGLTHVSQQRIAGISGLSLRTVRNAIIELERLGYVSVVRRELIARASDGRPRFGGKGVSNVYGLCLARQMCETSPRARRLAAPCDRWNAPLETAEGKAKCPTNDGNILPTPVVGARQNGAPKKDDDCPPTPTDTSYQNSVQGLALGTEQFGKLLAALQIEIGEASTRAWFKDVVVQQKDPETVEVVTNTAFNAYWLRTRYEIAFYKCWNRVFRSVPRIEFVARSEC